MIRRSYSKWRWPCIRVRKLSGCFYCLKWMHVMCINFNLYFGGSVIKRKKMECKDVVIETNVGPLLTRFNANIRLTIRSKATMARILEYFVGNTIQYTVFQAAFFIK